VTTELSRGRWAALLVGTASNNADLPPLPSVRQNLTDLQRVLTEPELGGMDPANVLVVSDPAAEHDMLDPLARLADQDLDVLLVYYAGHGQTDEAGDLYLATTSTPNRAAGLEWRSIEFRRVQRVIRRAAAGVRLVVLDCCFAGRALDVMASGDAVLRGAVGTAGAVTWVASPADKTAMAPAGEPHTAFTGALLGHLTGSTRTPGVDALTLDTLVRSTRETLRSLGRPEPQVQAQGNGLDLPIVRRPPLPADAPKPSPSQPEAPRRPRPTPKGFLLRDKTPELTAAVERRRAAPLVIPDEVEVPVQPLPSPLRSSWARKSRTHCRSWQQLLRGFPSPEATTWQLQVELIGDRDRELFQLALMTQAVGGTHALEHPAGRLGAVVQDSEVGFRLSLDRDYQWLNIDNDGLISPARFSVDLVSAAHAPCEIWIFLPPTVELFERDGIRSVGREGARIGPVTRR
jgi:hypothetical protein